MREAPAIARRAMALFAVVGVSLGASRVEMVAWLRAQSLWSDLSPSEVAFISDEAPDVRQQVNFSWRSEAVLVLAWAIGMVERLPDFNVQCDPGKLQDVLPPSAEASVEKIVSTARRRSEDELMKVANSILDAHWQARDAQIHGRPIPAHLDIEIIQERHHAINWVIGYGDYEWDDVATDT